MPALQRLGSGTDYILMAGKTDPTWRWPWRSLISICAAR